MEDYSITHYKEQISERLTYLTDEQREIIFRALELSFEQHIEQKRDNGEQFVSHPVAVACIVAEMHADYEVITAALLHDIVEDCNYKLKDIEEKYSEKIANLVAGVSKITHIKPDETSTKIALTSNEQIFLSELRKGNDWAENMRQLFISSVDHPRILIIKLADRLHNMRTLDAIEDNSRRKRIAQETFDIYAPLANRLGMYKIKWELEDLSFRYLASEIYSQIKQDIAIKRSTREQIAQITCETIKDQLAEEKIIADVNGRPKHIYSIWRKMNDKGLTFEQVHDTLGIRIIVDSQADCYAALGVVHTHWTPLPGEFTDYIARPKENGYKSLHTGVVGPNGKPMEVQIRTREMHDLAEQGVAAHWRYKESGHKLDTDFANKISWLRAVKIFEEEAGDASEMVESMRTDIFSDRVYVFTPKGDLLNLPAGSTPIDFAYHIHTEVGHRCRGARVNGKMVRLDYQLESRDRVEIITTKKAGPSRDWLNEHLGYVRTRRARSKIRQWFRTQDREVNITAGRQTLDRLIKQLYLRSVSHEDAALAMGYDNLDDFLAAIGYGDIATDRLSSKLIDMLPKDRGEGKGTDESLPDVAQQAGSSGPIAIRGVDGLLTRLAQCCNPLPGDDIVGYVTRGRGVTIHKAECPNVMNRNQEQERMIQAHWGADTPTYPVPIIVRAWNRTGLLRDISSLVAADGINISASATNTNPKSPMAVIFLTLSVRDAQQLTRIMDRIERVQNVVSVERYRPDGGKAGKK